jgi:uncharacterized repeat protein (TIGR01451 family)
MAGFTVGFRSRTLGVLAALFLIAAASPLRAQSGVTLVKSTNGQDANSAPGPIVAAGSTVTWTYVVTAGSRDLTSVAVTDDQGVTVSCPATTVLAGSSMICTASGIATAGQYTNVGTVNALESGVPVSASDSSHYYGQPPGLFTLVKSTNGQDANLPPGPTIAVGAAVNWTYVVTNGGSNTITAVAVTDDQGVVVSCPQNTIAAGQSMTCTASGVATAGQYTNVGTATATDPIAGALVASDPSHYFGQSNDLDYGDAPDTYGTTFAANGASHLLGTGVFLGACVDAELDGQPSAGSSGDDTAAGTAYGNCAVAGDDEDGVTFNGALTAGQSGAVTVVANAPCTLSAWIDFNGNGVFDTAEMLFPGGTALASGSNPLTFPVPPGAVAGPAYARFRCTTDGEVPPTGSARDGEVEDYTVAIATSADLSVTKSGTPTPVTPGTNLTFTITVINAGPSNAAAATLSDLLPAGTTFGSLTTPGGWSCTAPAAGATGSIQCTNPSMQVGSAVFTLAVTVSASVIPGSTIMNTATASSATSDPTPAANSGTSNTLVGPGQADLSVTKSASPNPVQAGSNLTYAIVVSNAGPSNAATVALADTLPANTTFVSLASPAGWSCTTPAPGAGGTVSCTIATLPPANAAFTLVMAVGPNVAPGTLITNTATISSATADATPGNNSSSTSTMTSQPIPALSLGVLVVLAAMLAGLGMMVMRRGM